MEISSNSGTLFDYLTNIGIKTFYYYVHKYKQHLSDQNKKGPKHETKEALRIQAAKL